MPIALYTFGLLDPAVEPVALADFVRRGGDILAASAGAPGFLGRPAKATAGPEEHVVGEDYGTWGAYALPDVAAFAGHDRRVHIATLSLWAELENAREFVYTGLHRDALRHRYDWFLKGSWPGYVLWETEEGATPTWPDGVHRYEQLARAGDSAAGFTFAAHRDRA
jgi:hypothetical protein